MYIGMVQNYWDMKSEDFEEINNTTMNTSLLDITFFPYESCKKKDV